MGKASRDRKEKHELRELAGYRPLIFDHIQKSRDQYKEMSKIEVDFYQQVVDEDLPGDVIQHFRDKIRFQFPIAYDHIWIEPDFIIDATPFWHMLSNGTMLSTNEWDYDFIDLQSCYIPPYENMCIEVEGPNYGWESYTKQVGFFIKAMEWEEVNERGIFINEYFNYGEHFGTRRIGPKEGVVLNWDGTIKECEIEHLYEAENGFKIMERRNFYFILKLLEFLNMRNVELIDGPPPPPRIQQLHQKHYGEPLYTYKVLSVGHPRKEYTEDGDYEHGTHATPRGHIVRGHPRRVEGHPFIPDGVYWIPAHTRGDFTKGEVFKDYRIVTPDEDQD